MIEITAEKIEVQKVIDAAYAPECGAVAVFLGTVRNFSRGKQIYRLEYEAYPEMAAKKIREIVEEAKKKWEVKQAAVSHRVGKLEVGEIAVVIAVSTPHRQHAFQACQFIIDRLKEVAPIWKKEVAVDGETWVDDHA